MISQSPVVGIHLDLKYVMPKKEYLHRWLNEIVGFGINTLLIEYEDKFPWSKYPFLQASNAFTPSELREFLGAARALGVRVVPLVQTLSHLEFALAHEELAHLRECPDIPTQINPTSKEAIAFVEDLINEVLEYHGPDEWFHIGGDEAWFLGANKDYAEEVEHIGEAAFWAKYTKKFTDYLIAAGKRPLVWDDVLWRGLPETLIPDFSKETIFAAWDYGYSEYKQGMYSHTDDFKKAGYEIVGVPCLNWGVLTPRHNHSLGNTNTWTTKARELDFLGVINSSWACFHTPLPTQMLYIAATAELVATGQAGDNWQVNWLEHYFGTPAQDIPQALEKLGTLWEVAVGQQRPVTGVGYGYMDMVLHYDEGQLGRRKNGAYPLDWEEIDFVALTRKKISLFKAQCEESTFKAKISELKSAFDEASLAIIPFAQNSKFHVEESQLLAAFARYKALYVRILESLLYNSGDSDLLYGEFKENADSIRHLLLNFLEPDSVEKIYRAWCQPALKLLEENR
jgi:hypothetical protein